MQPCDSSTDNAFVNNTSSSFSDSFLGFDGQRPVFKDVMDVVSATPVQAMKCGETSEFIGAKWVGHGLYAFEAGSMQWWA
jgi:hypothetical protein